jgi:hypothetical protein
MRRTASGDDVGDDVEYHHDREDRSRPLGYSINVKLERLLPAPSRTLSGGGDDAL